MIKKTYEKPEMQMLEADMEQQILAGSLTSIWTTGLDDEEEFEYGNDDNKSGSLWDDAW